MRVWKIKSMRRVLQRQREQHKQKPRKKKQNLTFKDGKLITDPERRVLRMEVGDEQRPTCKKLCKLCKESEFNLKDNLDLLKCLK